MKRIFTRVAATLAAGTLLVGGVAACGDDAADGMIQIRSATFPGEFYFTDVVAEKKGFFSDEGVQVKFVEPQSGTTSTQLMESGQVNVMINDGMLSLKAFTQGLGVTLVGSGYNRSAWTIYASDADPDLAGTAAENPRGLQALKGKKIGVTGLNAGTDLTLQAVLKANNIDPTNDVNRIGVGLLSAAVGQFSKKNLDAYVYGPPAGAVLGKDKLAHKFYVVRDGDTVAASVVQGGYLASTKWLSEGNNRDVAKKWIAAQQKAINWISDSANLEEAADMFAEAFGGTADDAKPVVTSLAKDVFPHNLEGLKVPRKEYANSVATLKQAGLLTGDGPSYEEAVDEMGRVNDGA